MRRADTRICECTRPVILCVHISAQNHNKIRSKADKETRRKSKADEPLTNQESKNMTGYSAPYSYQTPCCSLARMRSRVRQLEHAHM